MGTLTDHSNNKKKYLIFLLVFVILGGIYMSLMDTREQMIAEAKEKKDIVKTKKIEIKPDNIFSLDQMTTYNNRMDKIEEKSEEDKNAILKEIQKLNDKIEGTATEVTKTQDDLNLYKDQSEQKINNVKGELETNLGGVKNELSSKIEKAAKDKATKIDYTKIKLPALHNKYTGNDFLNGLDLNGATQQQKTEETPPKPKEKKGMFLKISTSQTVVDTVTQNANSSKNSVMNKIKNAVNAGVEEGKKIVNQATGTVENTIHIDMGIADAMLLTGVDAPTSIGGNTQEPLPALLSIRGESLIANGQFQDFSGCMLLATATGSASTNRATLRLSRISCRSADGKRRIEADIQGEVLGEDSKPGLKGRLVSRNGAIIMKGLMAAFAQGVATAFSGVPNQLNLTGTSANFTNGAVTGGGQALNTLADFYISMAKEMYPVIEVKGGRMVSVYFRGQDIAFTEVVSDTVFHGTKYSFTRKTQFNNLDVRLQR